MSASPRFWAAPDLLESRRLLSASSAKQGHPGPPAAEVGGDHGGPGAPPAPDRTPPGNASQDTGGPKGPPPQPSQAPPPQAGNSQGQGQGRGRQSDAQQGATQVAPSDSSPGPGPAGPQGDGQNGPGPADPPQAGRQNDQGGGDHGGGGPGTAAMPAPAAPAPPPKGHGADHQDGSGDSTPAPATPATPAAQGGNDQGDGHGHDRSPGPAADPSDGPSSDPGATSSADGQQDQPKGHGPVAQDRADATVGAAANKGKGPKRTEDDAQDSGSPLGGTPTVIARNDSETARGAGRAKGGDEAGDPAANPAPASSPVVAVASPVAARSDEARGGQARDPEESAAAVAVPVAASSPAAVAAPVNPARREERPADPQQNPSEGPSNPAPADRADLQARTEDQRADKGTSTHAATGLAPLASPAGAILAPLDPRSAPPTSPAQSSAGAGFLRRPNQGGAPADAPPQVEPGAPGSSAGEGSQDEAGVAGPTGVEPLAESLPLDLAAIDRALVQFLDEVEEAGGAAADLLFGDGIGPWLIGAAFATTACVLARRSSRKARPDPALVFDGEAVPVL
jgi:hypothetical protein